MDYGLSLVKNRLIHASDLSGEDAIAWQVVCPNETCRKPLRKVRSTLRRREYLAHYAATTEVCELRVRRIVRDHFIAHPDVVEVPSGQTLARFLAKFEDILLELRHDRMELRAKILKCQDRPVWRQMIYAAYDKARRDEAVLAAEIDHVYKHLVPPEAECWHATMRYLLAANTFRVFMFAITFAVCFESAEKDSSQVASLWSNLPNRLLAKWWDRALEDERCDVIRDLIRLAKMGALWFVHTVATHRNIH